MRSLGFPQELCLVLLTVGGLSLITSQLSGSCLLLSRFQLLPSWPFPYWSLFLKPSPLRRMHGSWPHFPCTDPETSQIKKPTLSTQLPRRSPLSTPLPRRSPAHFQNHSLGNSATVNLCCPFEWIWDHLRDVLLGISEEELKWWGALPKCGQYHCMRCGPRLKKRRESEPNTTDFLLAHR